MSIYSINFLITMAGLNLSDESKERFNKVLDTTKTVAHYGWIPFILYLGWSATSNKPNLVSYVSHSFIH